MGIPPLLTKLQLATKNDVMRRSVEPDIDLFNFFIRELSKSTPLRTISPIYSSQVLNNWNLVYSFHRKQS